MRVTRKALDAHVFVLKHCNVHTSRNTVQISPTGPRPCEAAEGLRFFRTSHNHESRGRSRIQSASTMEQCCDGSVGTKCVVVDVKALLRHIFQRDDLSNPGENSGLCHVTLGTKFRVEHMATQTLVICGFRQEVVSRHTWAQTLCRAPTHANHNDLSHLPRSQMHRTRQAYASQSCVCENWICKRFVHNRLPLDFFCRIL